MKIFFSTFKVFNFLIQFNLISYVISFNLNESTPLETKIQIFQMEEKEVKHFQANE